MDFDTKVISTIILVVFFALINMFGEQEFGKLTGLARTICAVLIVAIWASKTKPKPPSLDNQNNPANEPPKS